MVGGVVALFITPHEEGNDEHVDARIAVLVDLGRLRSDEAEQCRAH